ncbi:MAG: hypothetical protein ACT4QG_20520 [Sporichthyaceae bacterium]
MRDLGIRRSNQVEADLVDPQSTTTVLAMSADGWAAAGNLATAAVALVAVIVAYRQVREARLLREEQAQPYVAVFMESSGASEFLVDIVVRNFGTTVAHEVRVVFDPQPQRSGRGGSPAEDVWLPAVIPTLVPGQEWRTLWDSGKHRNGSGLPDRHEVSVEYLGTRKRKPLPKSTFVLDWSAHWQRRYVVTYGVHDVAKALREIKTTIAKWNENVHGGLAVYSRHGDAQDIRDRAVWSDDEGDATTDSE